MKETVSQKVTYYRNVQSKQTTETQGRLICCQEVLGDKRDGKWLFMGKVFLGWWKCPKFDSGDGYTTLNKLNLLNLILWKVNSYDVNYMSILKSKLWYSDFPTEIVEKFFEAFRLLVRIYVIQIFNPFMEIFSSVDSIMFLLLLFTFKNDVNCCGSSFIPLHLYLDRFLIWNSYISSISKLS